MLLDRVKPWDLLQKAIPHCELENFGFYVPIELVKSHGVEDGKRPIRGVASTPHKDLQDEDVVQKGLDVRYFLKHGYFNDDHKPGAENKVGQPTVALIKACKDRNGKDTTGLWTEGFLWKEGLHKGADALYELTQALEESNADRRMGFSIQGKVLRREKQRIIKAWVQDVAVTPSPINTNTWMSICEDFGKSVWANQNDVTDLRKSIAEPDFYKSNPLIDADGWEELKKEEEESGHLKALSAQSNPMSPQSLEDNLKITTYRVGDFGKKKEDDVSKALRWCYATARERGWSPEAARSLALASVTRMVLS